MTRGIDEAGDTVGANPRLADAQISVLAAYGERRTVAAGDVLFQEGGSWVDLFIVLSGKVAIVGGYQGPDERLIVIYGAGRLMGELSMLTGQPAPSSAVVVAPGEVLAVPVERLGDVLSQDTGLGDLILGTYLTRRSILISHGIGMRIIGSRYSPDVRRLRDFAARNRLPHGWVDLEDDPGTESLLRGLGVAPEETPIVILFGNQLLRNPSNVELAAEIGLPAPAQAETVRDLIVVGAGPAGLSAAVYGASEGLVTLTLDAVATGGQAGTSTRIENYLGFPTGISGAELADRAVIQAKKFGADIMVPAQATSLRHGNGQFQIGLADGSTVCGRTVVLATGASYRRLDLPRMAEFESTSVYYAATRVEAELCRGDPVAILGGGNSAGQGALFLAKYVPHVWLLVREPELGANMSRYLVDQVTRTDAIEVLGHTEVRELLGESSLTGLVVADAWSGDRRQLDARGLFVFIGATPSTDWLGSEVALDDEGFILTGPAAGLAERMHAQDAAAPPSSLATSLPGLFAAGDVRSGSTKRVASAVGEGAMAIRLVHERMQFG